VTARLTCFGARFAASSSSARLTTARCGHTRIPPAISVTGHTARMFARNTSQGGHEQTPASILEHFERGEFIQPSEAESLLVGVFEACGYPVTEKGFVGSGNALLEVDCLIRARIDGSLKMIAVEVKAGSRPAGIESVQQAFNLKTAGPFDRAMIISRLGFSADALQHADTIGLGKIDLFGPEYLRNWLSKQAEPQEVVSKCETIVHHAMRELAKTPVALNNGFCRRPLARAAACRG
jgi:hypothetical protein